MSIGDASALLQSAAQMFGELKTMVWALVIVGLLLALGLVLEEAMRRRRDHPP